MITKSKILFSMLAAGAMALSSHQAEAIIIDFGNTQNGEIDFNGNTDSFSFGNGPSGFSLAVTNVFGGVGDSVNNLGKIGGTFTIGAISISGGVQTASVTGSGTMTIRDSSGNLLTGTLTWDSIQSSGTGGTINVNGSLNLTGIAYAGSESDLNTLKFNGGGIEAVTFQFIPGLTLTQLTADGTTNATSFSGSIASIPDGGSTVALLGLALVGIEGLRRKAGSFRKLVS